MFLNLNAQQFLHTCAIVHPYSFLDLHLATRKTQYITLHIYLPTSKHITVIHYN
jgi:hypothetical protein